MSDLDNYILARIDEWEKTASEARNAIKHEEEKLSIAESRIAFYRQAQRQDRPVFEYARVRSQETRIDVPLRNPQTASTIS